MKNICLALSILFFSITGQVCFAIEPSKPRSQYDQSVALKDLFFVQLETIISGSVDIDLTEADLIGELRDLVKKLHLCTAYKSKSVPTLRLSITYVPVEEKQHIAYDSSLELYQGFRSKDSKDITATVWSDSRLFAFPDSDAKKRVIPIVQDQLDKFVEDYRRANPTSGR